MVPYNRNLKQRAQALRTNSTPQENKLWYQFLRKHNINFTRQKTIDNYIADFYCAKLGLVIELDGTQHFTSDAMEYDNIRTEVFKSLGIIVLRFTNADVDKNFPQVCDAIQHQINKNSTRL